MADANLTVAELINLLQRKIHSGEATGNEYITWNHRDWGQVAICDVEIISESFDFGPVSCIALKPAKFVPKETTTEWCTVSIHHVPPDKKIAAIKALRCANEGMGLAQAKIAIESITPVNPYVIKHIHPNNIQQIVSEFKQNCPTVHISIEGADEEDVPDFVVNNTTNNTIQVKISSIDPNERNSLIRGILTAKPFTLHSEPSITGVMHMVDSLIKNTNTPPIILECATIELARSTLNTIHQYCGSASTLVVTTDGSVHTII